MLEVASCLNTPDHLRVRVEPCHQVWRSARKRQTGKGFLLIWHTPFRTPARPGGTSSTNGGSVRQIGTLGQAWASNPAPSDSTPDTVPGVSTSGSSSSSAGARSVVREHGPFRLGASSRSEGRRLEFFQAPFDWGTFGGATSFKIQTNISLSVD